VQSNLNGHFIRLETAVARMQVRFDDRSAVPIKRSCIGNKHSYVAYEEFLKQKQEKARIA